MLRVFFLSALLALSSGYSIQRSNGTVCSLCVDTLEAVKAATTAPEVEKLVTDLSTLACSVLPEAVRGECIYTVKIVIKDNFEILRELTRIWGPQDLCELAHLCPKENDVALEGKVCDVCVDAVSVARFAINEPAFRKVLETYAETMCKATGPVYFVCAKAVDYIMDTVFDKLAAIFKQFEDEDVCKLIHLCPKKTFSIDEALLSRFGPAVNQVDIVHTYYEWCDDCVDLAEASRWILEKEELKSALVAISNFGCSFLPDEIFDVPIAEECKKSWKRDIEEEFEVVKEFLEEINTSELCQAINMCPNNHLI